MRVLVCGTAGCIASNLMRYVLYRSKDFKFVSFDKFINPVDYKNIYHHENHKFYIGDACDINFLKRLVFIEKPTVIVSGLFYHKNSLGTEYVPMIEATLNLASLGLPIIQVGPPTNPSYDDVGIYRSIKNILLEDNRNVYLEVPNVFGQRQKPLCLLYMHILNVLYHNITKGTGIGASDKIKPWVYAEDLASYIWYILEQKLTGHIRMPALGWASDADILHTINSMYKIGFTVFKNKDMDLSGILEYGKPTDTGWVADSKDLKESLIKTIKWYDANRWAFRIYKEG